MKIARLLSPKRVIELKSKDKEGAFLELVTAIAASRSDVNKEEVYKETLEREELSSTWIESGLAIPHARVALRRGGFVIAVGRSRDGIEYRSPDGKPVNLLVMIAGDDPKNTHLKILAALADFLKEKLFRKKIIEAASAKEIFKIFTQEAVVKEPRKRKPLPIFTRTLLKQAKEIGEKLNVHSFFVDVDVLQDAREVKKTFGTDAVMLTKDKDKVPAIREGDKVIEIPAVNLNRQDKIKMAALLALSKKMIKSGDILLYLTGNPSTRALDTVMIFRTGSEEHRLFISGREYTFDQILKHEVLERVITLACEIASEGREGKPLGALFVLGDVEKVIKYSKPLVINPFRGYTEAERNILDPVLEETIKELSSLDGAFLIDREGVILACGLYLRPRKSNVTLPSGLGARHEAAASITACTNSLAVTISESTGTVTIFRRGQIFMKIEKIRGTSS